MANMHTYGCQAIDDTDIQAVTRCLKSPFLTQGPEVENFENEICTKVDAPFCVAVSNASAGLHIAMIAIEVGPGDLVWTTPISFVATAACALHQGAFIDFIDIDPKTWNIDIDLVEERLTQAASKNFPLPKAIVAVHFAGLPCDMGRLRRLTQQFGIFLIEDAAHALGATYLSDGSIYSVGSTEHSDITVFSLHPVKPITSGEGGLITTGSIDLASKIRELRSHGITKDKNKFHEPNPPPWWYEQQDLGLNYRLSDIQAALGRSQLQKSSGFISTRKELSELYKISLNDEPLDLQFTPAGYGHAHHIEVIKLNDPLFRLDLFSYLQSQKIGVNVHYIPLYKHPFISSMGYKFSDCPAAEDYYSKVITIPLHTQLEKKDIEFVSQHIKYFLEKS